MPHATNTYPFEWKLFSWANDFAARRTGDNARAFLMLLDARGAVMQVHVSDRCSFDPALKEQLAATAPAHLFYDPFDFPEYGYLSWSGLSRETAERLMGSAFEPADFSRPAGLPSRRQTPEVAGFPAEWGVMF